MGNKAGRLAVLLESLIACVNSSNFVRFKAIIDRHPKLMWTRDDHGRVITSHLLELPYQDETVKYTLAYIREKIIGISKTAEERDQMLKDTFESKDITEKSPVFFAVWNVNLLSFLVEECCPSKLFILNERDNKGATLVHQALSGHFTDAFEYIVERAPLGTGILHVKDVHGLSVIDYAKFHEKECKNTRVYKWRLVEFLKERNLLNPNDRVCV